MANNLFEALASIGATMDPIWEGEWEGPIMFRDDNKNCRLMLVQTSDHDDFDVFKKEHPEASLEVTQAFARNMLVKIASRPFNPNDYE